MASEFDFLRAKWPKLAAIAADASRLVDIIPDSALNSLKTFCESSANIALDIYEIQVPGGATQVEKLEALQESGFVSAEILQKFHNVRTAVSRAGSDRSQSADIANACLVDCRSIGQWLFRESEKEGIFQSRDYSPEYNMPIKGVRSHAPDPDDMSREYKVAKFMRNYGSYISLFLAVVVIVGIIIGITSIFRKKTEAVEDPTLFVSATPTITFTPEPVSIVETPEPTEAEPEYVYIDDLPIASEFAVAHYNTFKWDYKTKQDQFQSNNQTYDRGLGMFLFSESISNDWGRDFISWNLNGEYEKIQFDLFADPTWSYGNSSEFGQYRVYIYADNEKVYESEAMYYDSIVDDRIIILPPDTLTLEVQLSQKKGTKGTLCVVMGDFRLYPYATTDE